jgi:hypothetical protein
LRAPINVRAIREHPKSAIAQVVTDVRMKSELPARRSRSGGNMTNAMNKAVFCIPLGALLTSLAGCSAEALDPSHSEPPISTTTAELIYEESYSDTGRLQVFRDSNGHLGWGVIGGRNDDPVDVSRHLDHSLAAMHRGLRPNVAVPAQLLEFDKEIAKVPLKVRPEAVAPRTKDNAAFLNATCHDFPMSNGTLHWWNCVHTDWMNDVQTSVEICPGCGDASFFWNVDSPLPAIHYVYYAIPFTSSPSEDCGGAPPIYPAPAGTWGWHNWWGGYCPGRAGLYNGKSGGGYGGYFMGITAHWWQPSPAGAL